jgi:hypothetical protein
MVGARWAAVRLAERTGREREGEGWRRCSGCAGEKFANSAHKKGEQTITGSTEALTYLENVSMSSRRAQQITGLGMGITLWAHSNLRIKRPTQAGTANLV